MSCKKVPSDGHFPLKKEKRSAWLADIAAAKGVDNLAPVLKCQNLQWAEFGKWHLVLKSAIFVSCYGKYLIGSIYYSMKVVVASAFSN